MTRSLIRATYRLFAIVGAATTATYFGLVALLWLLQKPSLPRIVQGSMQAVAVLTPIGVAMRWIFERLRPNYTARTARRGAIAFGVFMPVSWGLAFPLSTLVGGYSENLARLPFFGVIGAITGVVIMTALLSLVPCAFMLWTQRHDGEPYRARN